MNKSYICYGAYAFVERKDESKITREYEHNLGEVLVKENVIETLEQIIEKDTKDKDNLIRKKTYLKVSSGKGAWSIYIIVALYFLMTTGIISSIFCLGIGKVIINLKKNAIKNYTKKLKSLNYKLIKTKNLLEDERKEIIKIKSKEHKNNTIYNEYVNIDDDKKLARLERDLQLAYLYKLKEDIIQKKILEDNINDYLNELRIKDETLDNIDKKVILNYANEKKKILIK